MSEARRGTGEEHGLELRATGRDDDLVAWHVPSLHLERDVRVQGRAERVLPQIAAEGGLDLALLDQTSERAIVGLWDVLLDQRQQLLGAMRALQRKGTVFINEGYV